MKRLGSATLIVLVLALILPAHPVPEAAEGKSPGWLKDASKKMEKELVQKYGEVQRERVHRGLQQVASVWYQEDGDRVAFESFVQGNFAGDEETLDTIFNRFQTLLEALDGHMNEIVLAFRRQTDLDIGPILPFDEVFAGFAPGAHLGDDMFDNKLAFIVLLNFPVTTLEQKLENGPTWSRRQWAETRLAGRFADRIPAEVNQAIALASAESDQYIAGYNIWMHHLLDDDGNRLFPAKMRLLSHWNLRDEIKAQYGIADGGIERQRMIQQVMERIVTQTIPAIVVDNPHVDWNPYRNTVAAATVTDGPTPPPDGLKVAKDPEPDTRYEVLLNTFLAVKQLDPYSPNAPTWIERRFNMDREIPEERVEAMFDQVLTSPLLGRVGELIATRLGRDLEPFDIWYNGFRPGGAHSQAELDEITRKRYPDADAYRKDMPNLLEQLDFSAERAADLTDNILVEPARGSGHAWGAQMSSAKSHLRTRVGADGMDYKGFNIAVHEMGHNVEQTLSLNEIDFWLLNGVPNTAFTEALAFVFQERDLDLLGLSQPDPQSESMQVLESYWGTCEIAAVALVDMAVWQWMYDHPNATPEDLKKATLDISKKIWNKYYAPVFNKKDVVLLGVYSHMIHSFLYLPDYPIGGMIALQINEQIQKAGAIGPEFERMVQVGNVAPDIWMINATGKPVGPEALLEAAGRALADLGG
jgi:hypothetical protein